jgi:hypothetical protein
VAKEILENQELRQEVANSYSRLSARTAESDWLANSSILEFLEIQLSEPIQATAQTISN